MTTDKVMPTKELTDCAKPNDLKKVHKGGVAGSPSPAKKPSKASIVNHNIAKIYRNRHPNSF